MSKIERRAYTLDFEVREDSGSIITGYAALFNTLSQEIWGFHEIIRPGAFSKALGKDDVRALWNHDPNFVLGRNKAGTLKLQEDERGLRVEITPPETTWAKDLIQSMRRGDVNQMSFGFTVVKEKWEDNGLNTPPVRELLECNLFDVSVVTFPAYTETSVGVRSMKEVYDSYAAAAQASRSAAGIEARSTQARISLLRKKLNLLERI